MKKVKIAIWLDKSYHSKAGGGFSYYDKLVHIIDSYHFDSSVEVCFAIESPNADHLSLKKEVINLYYYKRLPVRLSYSVSKIPVIGSWIISRIEKKYKKILNDASVRVIYYIRQTECKISGFPFIATNWDIAHCSTFAFPEAINAGAFSFSFALRHHFYTQILPQALMIFAESEAGKNELIKYTNIDGKKIKVVPIFAGNCVNVKYEEQEDEEFLNEKQLEKQKYFFYPAQFWAHKNHTGLLQAFAKFIELYPGYKLVFTGSDKGNLEYIQSFVSELKIEDSVLFSGFLSEKQINILYHHATALVMASYSGPTNMPPIEAMELGCPVICSDLKGHYEILGDSAIYFNPADHDELCNAMIKMVQRRSFYSEEIENRNKQSVFKIECAIERINEYFKEIATIRNCWR